MTDEKSKISIKTPFQEFSDLPGMDKCTIIVPTYNQPTHLRRLLQYYDGLQISLSMIIADSSHDNIKKINQENIAACKNLNIRLMEYNSSIHPYKKVIDADNQVTTPFVVNCADDDFLILSGVQKTMDFLFTRPEYGVAQGQYYAFQQSKDNPLEIKFSGNRGYYTLSQIDASSPLERLFQMADGRNPLFYAVFKTPIRRQLNVYWLESGVIPDDGELDPYVYSEIYDKMLTAIYTRIASLPFLYYIRDRSLRRIQSSTKDWDYGFWLNVEEKNRIASRQFALFRGSIASHLSQESGIPMEDALKITDAAFAQYQAPRNIKSRFQQTTEAVGSFLSQYPIGNHIRNRYQQWFGQRYRVRNSMFSQSTFPGNPIPGSPEYVEYTRIVETIHNCTEHP